MRSRGGGQSTRVDTLTAACGRLFHAVPMPGCGTNCRRGGARQLRPLKPFHLSTSWKGGIYEALWAHARGPVRSVGVRWCGAAIACLCARLSASRGSETPACEALHLGEGGFWRGRRHGGPLSRARGHDGEAALESGEGGHRVSDCWAFAQGGAVGGLSGGGGADGGG